MDFIQYFYDIINFFRDPLWRYLIYGIVFILAVLWLAFVYWTYRDARLRNTSAIFWAIITFILPFLGLFLYLILRPPEFIEDVVERDLEIKRMEMILASELNFCPSCKRQVDRDFLICPSCRKKLKKSCLQCGKPLNLDWKVCPYCRAEQ